MILVPVFVLVAIVMIFTPSSSSGSRSSGRRRKSRSYHSVLSGKRRYTSRRGVMCGPGGSKRKR